MSVADAGLYQKLNSVWHKRALNLFMFVVLAHWAASGTGLSDLRARLGSFPISRDQCLQLYA